MHSFSGGFACKDYWHSNKQDFRNSPLFPCGSTYISARGFLDSTYASFDEYRTHLTQKELNDYLSNLFRSQKHATAQGFRVAEMRNFRSVMTEDDIDISFTVNFVHKQRTN